MVTSAGGTNWYRPSFHTLDEEADFWYPTASVIWAGFSLRACHKFQGGNR